MSRLAKKPILIPEKVEVTLGGETLTVKGPTGTLTRTFSPAVAILVKDGGISISPKNEILTTKMLVGTTVAHIRNMIAGSREAFVKKLIIEGIGFKAEVKGSELVLNLGFSHQIKMPIPKDLKVVSEKGVLTISGADIEAVGAFAANIRSQKKPEPYKGKGIRYDGEVIRRKQGKKTT
ncbi:MAG: 50S ribosomal protein L6 [Parcubacteria group bacterium GW2011_GWA2_49_9]|nr:MAG: 50S ribosomal protein L6 [Parcubacteria group bacterium GW2011_GWA2_49_9]